MTEVNIIHSVKTTDTGSEPVAVDEVKQHFVIDFDNHDSIIDIMRLASRKLIESSTGLSLVKKSVVVVATLYENYSLELPYTPMTTLTSVKRIASDGSVGSALVAGTDFINFGAEKEQIAVYNKGLYEIKYESLLAPVPQDIRLAIMAQTAYFYEHRGEEFEDKGICLLAEGLLSNYKRNVI